MAQAVRWRDRSRTRRHHTDALAGAPGAARASDARTRNQLRAGQVQVRADQIQSNRTQSDTSRAARVRDRTGIRAGRRKRARRLDAVGRAQTALPLPLYDTGRAGARRLRRALALVMLLGAAAPWLPALHAQGAATPASATAAPPPPPIYVAAVDDIIHPISAEFMSEAITTADTHGAAALIFTLETPGGLVDSTRTIVSRIISARTPIIVFVGPGAARAASAGFLITLAADVAVMAPGAHIGAAHPVTGSGEKVGETMEAKMESDVAAYARSLAEGRKRNVQLADEAVRKSRAFTSDEALQASPPLIDFVSPDVDALIRALDGRTVRRFDGRTITLHTANARTDTLEMSRRQRFLSTIAHPQIAYVLFSLGLLGLTVELWNPGSILPGVAGGLCLLLAFLAFQVLPINTTGLLLIAFGLLLLILELKVPSYGVLGSGGTLSLVLGAVIMMDRSSDLRIGLAVAIPPMLTLAAIFLFLGRLALTAQRRPATTGGNSLIGRYARAVDAMTPQGRGHVAVHGELWTAIATATITAGTEVRIVDRQGLTLTVEPATTPPDTTARPTTEGEPSS